jgi:hypothetical protein
MRNKYSIFDFSRICRVTNSIGAMCSHMLKLNVDMLRNFFNKKKYPNIHLSPWLSVADRNEIKLYCWLECSIKVTERNPKCSFHWNLTLYKLLYQWPIFLRFHPHCSPYQLMYVHDNRSWVWKIYQFTWNKRLIVDFKENISHNTSKRLKIAY